MHRENYQRSIKRIRSYLDSNNRFGILRRHSNVLLIDGTRYVGERNQHIRIDILN